MQFLTLFAQRNGGIDEGVCRSGIEYTLSMGPNHVCCADSINRAVIEISCYRSAAGVMVVILFCKPGAPQSFRSLQSLLVVGTLHYDAGCFELVTYMRYPCSAGSLSIGNSGGCASWWWIQVEAHRAWSFFT